MRKSRGLVLGLVAGLACTTAGIEAQADIDGVGAAIVAPAYDGSGGNPNSSYLRLFNGSFATTAVATTFTISIVGGQTGQLYGQPFTIQIPPHASPQYSLGTLLSLAGTSGAGAGVASGDTSFMLIIKDPDSSAGYQHVTFNGATTLFENVSICNNGLWTTTNPGLQALTNVHTSQLAGYPSSISFSNYFNAPLSDTIVIYDAGELNSGNLTSTAGNVVGTTTIQIPANTTVTKLFSTLETAVNWNPNSSQPHANVLVFTAGGAAQTQLPYLVLGQSIVNSTLGGSINMSTICAVNPTTGTSGFIAKASTGTVFALTANQNLEAFTVTNGSAVAAGTAIPTGTAQTNPTASITLTSGGFNFTLPDGKTVNYTLTAGASDINGTSDYQAVTTDGTVSAEITLTNNSVSPLAFSTYGNWSEYNDPAGDYPIAAGTVATGIATASAAMPTTGTASYTGNITGFAFNSTAFGTIKSGTVSLNANFANNTITGSVTSISVKEGAGDNVPLGTMNSINLTGTISGTGFTVTATPATAASGTYLNISGTSGSFTGSFSGPNAAEIVGDFAMTGGGTLLQAAFGAHQ